MRAQILALLLSLVASSAFAETHEVKMLNGGAAGPMIYEPDFVQAEYCILACRSKPLSALEIEA